MNITITLDFYDEDFFDELIRLRFQVSHTEHTLTIMCGGAIELSRIGTLLAQYE
jgi:hypothetical protein